MKARIGRLWRLAREQVGMAETPAGWQQAGAATPPLIQTVDGQTAVPPEQPVLLLPSGPRTVHVGAVLPARRGRWPLSIIRLPAVPKRAILTAGVCVGRAAPTIAKHLATRMLLGNAAPVRPDGILEITRIVYDGPLTPRATSAITKAILATRR